MDDNDEGRILTKWLLVNAGYAVDAAESAEEALSLFNSNIHGLVLTDNSMPGMGGTELARIIKQRSPTTPVMMYSGNPPDDQSGLDAVVLKPAQLKEIKEALDKLLGAE